ncbi:MAG TPA: ABC transporter permease [Candidatus Acidoferrales bacterium]|jgi:ABC-2 type transport system permease protein|nr:ABC transporter permease [Candidatus Acidoferrales bacterium]
MKSLYAIYRKEMGNYFVSPVAYVVVGVFLALSAFFFNYFLSAVMQQALQMQMQEMEMGMHPNIDVTMEVMRAFFGLLSTLVLFLTPMLTMGVFSEERKRGTMELLMTSPITEWQIVLGKFLASLTLFAIMLLPTAGYLIFTYVRSEPVPPWRMLIAGYLGIMLLGACLLALGSFISSLTENQLIAAVLTFAAFLIVWVIDLGRNAGGAAGDTLQYLSVIRHYDDFTRGVIDTSSLIYYLSFIGLFVFLTVRSVDSMRWRRA